MAKQPKNQSPEQVEDNGVVDESGVAGGEAGGTKAKRDRVTSKRYLKADGAETKNILEAEGIEVTVLGPEGGTIRVMLADLVEPIRFNAAPVFGINIVLTNAIGGKRGAEAWEDLQARAETITGGEWTMRVGGGEAVPSLLAEAIFAAYTEAGKETTLERVKEVMKGKDENWRKAALKDAAVNKHYLRIKAERARERADKAASAGGGNLDSLGLDL